MQKASYLLALLTILWVALTANSQNLLDGPDHASYDAIYNRYLISSSQNAKIVAIDSLGVQSDYITGMGAYIFGNFISGDTLYVGDSRGSVRAYDLHSGTLLWTLFLSGAHYIGGMDIDNSGYLYAADNNGFDSKVFKINPVDQTYEAYITSGLGGFVLNVKYDEPDNRLIVLAFLAGSPIIAIDLDDASLSEIVTPPAFDKNGLIIDNDRNVYITDYYGGVVYRYDSTFTNPPQFISDGHGSPSGLGYNHIDNILVVPNFAFNTVDFISLDDDDSDGTINLNDNCPDAPNFNQSDTDEDGDGDVCDGCPDDYNPGHEDTDEDGIEDACDNCPEHYNPGQEDTNENGVGDLCDYICGDANGEGNVNILDITYLIAFLYNGGAAPDPLDAADVNNSDNINILDVTYLISYLYKGGPEPDCPL